MNKYYPIVKRTFDCAASSAALLVLSPILLLVAIAIRLESRGPALYRSKRVGQYYKIFDLLKFRTMYVNADKDIKLMSQLNLYGNTANAEKAQAEDCPFCKKLGRSCSPLLYSDHEVICENFYFLKKEKERAFFKIKNDPRVTRIGKMLRRTSIDELPQLINILRGDMSLIGNRPLPLYEAEKLTYDQAIDRFNSPSGLTGLWQVTQRGSADVTERERIELDKEYTRTWSLRTDMNIFMRTFPALLEKESA